MSPFKISKGIITKKGIKLSDFVVDESLRLDVFISKMLQISRSKASNLVKNGSVILDKTPILKPSFIVEVGKKISINLDEKEDRKENFKTDFEIPIIYEDSDILVINKPANLVTHPAPSVKEPTLLDWLLDKNYALSNLNNTRKGIVHRLDKGTSGALVIAKTNKAHLSLAAQLKDRTMGRIYLALINLNLKENLVINRPIGRNPKNRLKKAIVQGARESKSAFLNLYSDDEVNLIAAKLFSGRTHQIRVHLSSINRYIIGDNLYGFKSQNDKIVRLMLHAYILYFKHPITGENMKFVANLDNEFLNYKNIKEKAYEKFSPNFIIGSFDDFHSWLCLT